jgi:hypothetical protein
MRIPTTLEILKRAAEGTTPPDIAAGMHLREHIVRKVLTEAGWPDLTAMTAWRAQYLAEEHRDVWAVADTVETLAASIRVNPSWVHAYTEQLDREALRILVSVMAAMLPKDIDAEEALAWRGVSRPVTEEGPKRHTKPRVPSASTPLILKLAAAGKTVEEIARKTRLLEDTVARVISEAGREAVA